MMFLRPTLLTPLTGLALAGFFLIVPTCLFAASTLPLETVIVYDFEDQPLGPIGLDGPDEGQPYWKSSTLDAEVIAFEGRQALQISSEEGGFTGLRFELPDQQGIRDYRARVRLRMMHSEETYQGLGFRGPEGASSSYDTLHVSHTGRFQVTSAGLDFPALNFGSYTAGEPFELIFEMDLYNRTWDIWLDGVREVTNRPMNSNFATSAGLGRFFFSGSSFYDGSPIVIDEFVIERSQALPVLLITEFDELPAGAIGTGGPVQGEPIAVAPSLLADVGDDGAGGQVLTLERMAWIGAEQPVADWAFLYEAEPLAGLVEADFNITPRLPGMYVATLHDSDGNDVASIQVDAGLNIELVFPGEAPIEVGEAELDEMIRIRLVCHLDQRDCSVGLNDRWVVFNQMFSDLTPDGIAIAGLRTGFLNTSPAGSRFDLHQVNVMASEVEGLPRQLEFIEQPVDIQCGFGQPLEVQVNAGDGEPAADMIDVYLRPVHSDITEGDLVGATTFTSEGVAEFPSLIVLRRGNDLRLRAEVDDPFNPVSVTSEPFNVLPGTHNSASYLVEPGDGVVGQTFDPPVALSIMDNCGETSIAGREIVLYILEGPTGATLSGNTALTNADGHVVFPDLTIDEPGSYRLAAQYEGTGISGSSSELFNIAVAPPATATFQTQPGTVIATESMTPAVEVYVEDIVEQPVPDGTDVTLTLVDPGTAVLSGATASTVDGVAIFEALQVSQPGSFQLRASVPDLPSEAEPVSDAFDVVPGPAALLSFESQPSSTVAGATISPTVTVRVTDSNGFDVSDGETVTLSIASGPAGAELSGTVAQSTTDGIASFNDLSLTVAGHYVLDAELDSGLASSSSSFDIAPTDPFQLIFTTQPSSATVNQALDPVVTVSAEDEYGNTVSDGQPITLAIVEGPETASLAGAAATTVDGLAQFPALAINQPSTFRLEARADTVPVDTRPSSDPFDILPGEPAAMSFAQQPTQTNAGASISPAVAVSVVDADGFAVADGTLVDIVVASGPGGAVLSGTTTRPTSDGLALFDDLSLDLSGEYSLQASVDAGAITTTSVPFNVLDTGPASATFLSQPSDTPVNEIMTPAVAVEVLDDKGGPVADGSAVVLVLVDPGEATMSGAVATTIDGVAVFDSLIISRPGGYQLRAEVSGLDPAEHPVSEPFEILADRLFSDRFNKED
jgi:hypothetical protein